MYHTLYKRLFSKVDAIHFPSQFIRDLFEAKNHFKSNGFVISNGIQKDFHPATYEKPKEWEGKTVITFTARYSKEKTHKVLIRALKYSRYEKQIQLVFAGSGPLQNKLEIESEHLPNKPLFGFHSRAEMVKILNCTDLYVHPSLIDIEPLSALEAMNGEIGADGNAVSATNPAYKYRGDQSATQVSYYSGIIITLRDSARAALKLGALDADGDGKTTLKELHTAKAVVGIMLLPLLLIVAALQFLSNALARHLR